MQCKADIGKLHDSCKIWDHICKLCCDVHGALNKKICTLYIECSQFLETKNYHLHSMCSILVRRIVLAIFATIIGKPHGMRSILKLTSVNWMLFLHFYGFLKLKPASGRYSQHLEIIICRLHNVAWCLQRVAANICKLHGLCHILKPTFANCLGPATLWK